MTMARLIGRRGETPQCRIFADDLSMHWFPATARIGDTCLCGQTVREIEGRPSPSAAGSSVPKAPLDPDPLTVPS